MRRLLEWIFKWEEMNRIIYVFMKSVYNVIDKRGRYMGGITKKL